MKVVLNPQTVTDHTKFFEQVFAESKPKATDDSLKHAMSRHRHSDGPMAYVKLKYKIDRININIAHKKILLDRKQNKELQGAPNSNSDKGITKDEDVTKPKIPKTSRKKNKDKTVESVVRAHKTINYRKNYIIIYNQRTDEADVYYLNNTGMVIQHYRTDNGRHSLFQSSPNTATIRYCCWYKRQDIVTSMLMHVPAISVRCMGAPHWCEGRCTCCCKKIIQTSNAKAKTSKGLTTAKKDLVSEKASNTGTIEVNSEIIVTPMPLNVLIDNMINTPELVPPTSNLIQKAFAFTTPDETKRRGSNKKLNFVVGTQILFNYKDGNEYYKIGPGGVISQHFKNVSQAFIEQHVVNNKNAIIKKVCCWFARQNLIHAWRNSKILPSNYMRTPHTCSLDECVCCCKPIKLSANKSNNDLKKLSLPDFANYTTEVCTKLPPLEFAFANHEPALLNDVVPDEPSVGNAVADAVRDNLVDKDEREKRMFICLKTKVLLEKTLDKLKNVSVQFNRKDKITAVLNIPVTTLSTNELRTLSDILTKAQKTIDALKPTRSGDATGNPCNPTATAPTNLNNIINDKEKNVQDKLRLTARNHLYTAFSSWSSLHNAEKLRSFKLFVNSKIGKVGPKAIKRVKSKLLAAIPTKRRNVTKAPEQTKQIIHSKTTKKRTTTKTLSRTNSYKSQTETKILKAVLQRTENSKRNNIQNKPGPSNDPLDITYLHSIVNKPFKPTGDPPPDIEKPFNSVENFVLIYDSSDENDVITDELPSLPTEIISTAQVNDDDCILGA
ncbi:hypothetical protein O3G_MSEX010506 [Manduca sexta]|uniref:Uncharacterized protein n=1 Tax=Manduca sexta TaxID=7130 RepID=A0A922CTP8_MANSE|nr:hypothetical protein O3G_MSEX010506 [Manduca sexta]